MAEKAVYSPDKNYKWDPIDTFQMTGQQFASFYHLLTQEVNSPSGAPIALKFEAFTVMMDIFKKAVEDGVITESSDMSEEMISEDNVHQLFNKEN